MTRSLERSTNNYGTPRTTTLANASLNFAFLANHAQLLVLFCNHAERYVFDDPVAALVKLRQFGEAFTQQIAAHTGRHTSKISRKSVIADTEVPGISWSTCSGTSSLAPSKAKPLRSTFDLNLLFQGDVLVKDFKK